MVIRVEAGMASQQGRFQEPTEMAIFDKPEENSNAKTPVGNEQMELFSPVDFGESEF